MSRAAFLAGLRQNPADLTAWLVYADWLDEQGDPTGAFVRLSLDFTAGRVPVEPDFAHVARFDDAFRAADADARELMAVYRSGLPVRLQVCHWLGHGQGAPGEAGSRAWTEVSVAVLAGRVWAGMWVAAQDGGWRPGRPVGEVALPWREPMPRAEAGRGPSVVRLVYDGRHPVPTGTILVEDPDR